MPKATTKKVETAEAAKNENAKLLVVKARQPSRRRAGRVFTPAPTKLPLDTLSANDIAAIEGDPQLIVSRE